MKRFASLLAAASMVVGGGALALTDGAATASSASAAAALPTLNIALTGTQGVSVSGSEVSGAVNVSSTYSGKGQGEWGLVRLDPGVTAQDAFGAVQAAHGDPNGLTPLASLFADAEAGSTTQTVLSPGNYVALNLTGNGNPGFATFTVSQSSSPAALPGANATERSMEFEFKGPKVLHDGRMLRTENDGFLVHMDVLIGAKSKAGAKKISALLKAGKDRKAQKLAVAFDNLQGPVSPGGMQQQVLNTRPGYYVQVCFMDTQDGREHTRLGMDRVIRVAK